MAAVKGVSVRLLRLNDGNGTKFQPDIVGFDKDINAVLIIDYESPNSSDARVPLKDWVPYANWAKGQKEAPPYFIVTTLPDKESPEWELRYTSENKYNVAFRGRRDEIRKNPFRFWYAHYQSERKSFDLSGIEMLNINCGAANVVHLDRI